MPLIQVSTDGENMIVVMGNVSIRALSVCWPRAGRDPPWERLGLWAPQPQLSTHVQTLPGGTATPSLAVPEQSPPG